MNNILNFLYGNLHFVAGLLLFGIGLIALIHFWKVKKALLGCEAALAGIQQGINLGIQQAAANTTTGNAAANTTTGNAAGTEVSLVMGNFRGEFEQAYTLTRKQSRSTFGLAVFIFILGAALLLGASVFLICVASDFSADLNSFLATAVLQGKSISTIADLASGLRLQAALIPALSGLILILASLIAALRVHRKAASQLEYYQRCLEEDKRVLISVELLKEFSAGSGGVIQCDQAVRKIIDSLMDLNKRDMGPEED